MGGGGRYRPPDPREAVVASRETGGVGKIFFLYIFLMNSHNFVGP